MKNRNYYQKYNIQFYFLVLRNVVISIIVYILKNSICIYYSKHGIAIHHKIDIDIIDWRRENKKYLNHHLFGILSCQNYLCQAFHISEKY